MGLWLIFYGIANQHKDSYLSWFENEHIDEKLSRPGYDWATHYELSTDSESGGTSEFVALFGSRSSRTFYDPSPAQIKPHQTELTKTMLGYRTNAVSLILSEEWCQAGEGKRESPVIASRSIRMWLFANTTDDQYVGAWCAQKHCPETADLPTTNSVRKFVASAGNPRHVVIDELSDSGAENVTINSLNANDLQRDPLIATLRVTREA